MDEIEHKKVEHFFYNAMSSYRIIPLLAACAHSPATAKLRVIEDSIDEVAKAAGIDKDALKQYIRTHDDWLSYVMSDFMFYATKYYNFCALPEISNTREELYRFAMTDQLKSLDWPTSEFKVTSSVIIDQGCGFFPFIKYFVEANPKLAYYVGFDKRPLESQVFLKQLQAKFPDINIEFNEEDFWKSNAKRRIHSTNATLFIGNFLHCFQSPKLTMICLLENYYAVEEVIAIEPTPGSELDFCFKFHMYMHSGGKTVEQLDIDEISSLFKETTVQKLNSQYTMYSFKCRVRK